MFVWLESVLKKKHLDDYPHTGRFKDLQLYQGKVLYFLQSVAQMIAGSDDLDNLLELFGTNH